MCSHILFVCRFSEDGPVTDGLGGKHGWDFQELDHIHDLKPRGQRPLHEGRPGAWAVQSDREDLGWMDQR